MAGRNSTVFGEVNEKNIRHEKRGGFAPCVVLVPQRSPVPEGVSSFPGSPNPLVFRQTVPLIAPHLIGSPCCPKAERARWRTSRRHTVASGGLPAERVRSENPITNRRVIGPQRAVSEDHLPDEPGGFLNGSSPSPAVRGPRSTFPILPVAVSSGPAGGNTVEGGSSTLSALAAFPR